MRILPISWLLVLLWLEVLVFVFLLSVSFSGCELYVLEIHYFGLLQV